jgi:uncharacterized protein
MAIINSDHNKNKHGVLYVSTAIIATSLFFLSFAFLNELTLDHHAAVIETYAQPSVEMGQHRDLVIDLGNGVKTSAQLTIPAIGKGPFPAALLIPGAGPNDMNYTAGTNVKPLWQIAEYLIERGFVVLRYDKRGIDDGGTIINNSLWGNMTYDDLKHDAEKAVNVLIQQPEVDPKKISLIGHSEGGEIATIVATANPDKVKTLVLMDELCL